MQLGYLTMSSKVGLSRSCSSSVLTTCPWNWRIWTRHLPSTSAWKWFDLFYFQFFVRYLKKLSFCFYLLRLSCVCRPCVWFPGKDLQSQGASCRAASDRKLGCCDARRTISAGTNRHPRDRPASKMLFVSETQKLGVKMTMLPRKVCRKYDVLKKINALCSYTLFLGNQNSMK